MERVIWLYWENLNDAPEPPHILLSRLSVRRNSGARVQLVTPDSLPEFLPELHENIEHIAEKRTPNELSIAIKTAFIRVFLLERYGGLYLDSDAVVLKPLDEVFDAIEQSGFACTRKTSRERHHIPNNFIGSIPGASIISMYAQHMRYELERRTVFEWGEVGSRALTPLVNGNIEHATVFSEHRIHPIINNDQSLLADTDVNLEDVIPPDALICMLFHGVFDTSHRRHKGKLAQHTAAELYYGEELISKVFRMAIPEEEFQQVFGAQSEPSTRSDRASTRGGFLGKLRRLREKLR